MSSNFFKGQYEVTSKQTPMYKLKPSSGFASTTKRTLDLREKQPRDSAMTNKILNRTTVSVMSEDVRRSMGYEGDEENPDFEEYITVTTNH